MTVTERMIVADKERRATRVRASVQRIPNKYNGNPLPPELPPGIPQEVPPTPPPLSGRWPPGSEWTIAQCRAMRVIFKRAETEDVIVPTINLHFQRLQVQASQQPACASVLLPAVDDEQISFQLTSSPSVAGVEDPGFVHKLAFAQSFAPNIEHSSELWSLFTRGIFNGDECPPASLYTLTASASGRFADLLNQAGNVTVPNWGLRHNLPLRLEFNLSFSYVVTPRMVYFARGLPTVAVVVTPGYRRPVGFGKHAQQKGYCEMAACLIAMAHEAYRARQQAELHLLERPATSTDDFVAYGFTVNHTAVKVWKATVPFRYLAAIDQGAVNPPAGMDVEIWHTPSLRMERAIERYRLATLVRALFSNEAAGRLQ